MINIKSQKGIFSSFVLSVTSISPLQIEFIIKAIFSEKKSLAQQISGNRACMYPLACMYALCFKLLGKLQAVLAIQKAQLGALGWDKVRFKFLHFYTCKILHFSFTLLPSL